MELGISIKPDIELLLDCFKENESEILGLLLALDKNSEKFIPEMADDYNKLIDSRRNSLQKLILKLTPKPSDLFISPKLSGEKLELTIKEKRQSLFDNLAFIMLLYGGMNKEQMINFEKERKKYLSQMKNFVDLFCDNNFSDLSSDVTKITIHFEKRKSFTNEVFKFPFLESLHSSAQQLKENGNYKSIVDELKDLQKRGRKNMVSKVQDIMAKSLLDLLYFTVNTKYKDQLMFIYHYMNVIELPFDFEEWDAHYNINKRLSRIEASF